jgi:hypothetical protein
MHCECSDVEVECKEMLYFPHHYHSQCIQPTLLKLRAEKTPLKDRLMFGH